MIVFGVELIFEVSFFLQLEHIPQEEAFASPKYVEIKTDLHVSLL